MAIDRYTLCRISSWRSLIGPLPGPLSEAAEPDVAYPCERPREGSRGRGRHSGPFPYSLPRMTPMLYRSVLRSEAAMRLTSSRVTSWIFRGASNVSSYPMPYISLNIILSA
jgi:hypothetical protein